MLYLFRLQVEYVVAFLGTGLARAVAAPLNQNYRQVRSKAPFLRFCGGGAQAAAVPLSRNKTC